MISSVTCPTCQSTLQVNEKPLVTLVEAIRAEFEVRISQMAEALRVCELEVQNQREQISNVNSSIDQQVAEKLQISRAAIAADEARKARVLHGLDIEEKQRELAELREVLQQRDQKLTEFQKSQAELLRKQRELDDAKREIDETVEKKVQHSLSDVRERAKAEVEVGLKLKVAEKEEQISSMQRQIEELSRRADQSSQQLQGEVLELHLESLLLAKFPLDLIEPVPKGEFGGDVIQRVIGSSGQICGTIIWEAKRTKNWSDQWLGKLRSDQRAAKADISLLISEALPKDIDTFDLIDGVWIAHPRFAIPLAIALRQSLIDVSNARITNDGQQSKMEHVYQYLTGPQFKHRVEAIVESFSEMQDDLNRERRATLRLWAKREAQIQRVVGSTVGMYGDLQGIAGRALQDIPALQATAIEEIADDEKNA